MIIRALAPGEEHFLARMQYHALFTPPGADPFPRDIIEEPGIKKYYDNWGRLGDLALVIDEDWELVGAIWCRLFTQDNQGYGFVDENTPELSMAILPAYRGRGLGTQLLERFLDDLAASGCRGVSLSVDSDNPVKDLYERMGFGVVSAEGNPTMLKRF
ncbi:MAG: GNAT family N-acetyltransferase [Bacteroidota bacterium]